jgi:predicted TIM-barrel fold metal-dependent hydrolase
MKLSTVNMALSWQNPAATYYPGSPEENYNELKKANSYISDSAEKYSEKFIPAGWTDPNALGEELAIQLIEDCAKEFGFPVIKLNPAQNRYQIDSEIVMRLTEKIISLGAIPAYHFGADTQYTPPSGLENLAKTFSRSPIIAVHMGGGGGGYVEAEEHYQQAREIGLRNENIYYVLSAKRDTHMESDLITYTAAGGTAPERLICASDAPYGKQSWNFGGFRLMFETFYQGEKHPDPRLRKNPDLFDEDTVRNYLGGNLARLILKVYRKSFPD